MSNERKKTRSFIKGADKQGGDGTRKRENIQIELRKMKRDTVLAKRRYTKTPASSPIDKVQMDLLPIHAKGLSSTDPPTVLQAVSYIKSLMSDYSDEEYRGHITEIVSAGVVPKLVELARESTSEKIQNLASWALLNICEGKTSETKAVIEAGGIQTFLLLSTHKSVDIRTNAIWGLANIAGDNDAFRDIITASGGVKVAINAIGSGEIELMKIATFLLLNLCRTDERQADPRPLLITLPLLSSLLTHANSDIQKDAIRALQWFSDDRTQGEVRLAILRQVPNMLRRIIDLIVHTNDDIRSIAINTVGQIASSSNPIYVDDLIKNDALCKLVTTLKHGSHSKKVAVAACFATSNILAELKSEQLTVIFELGYVEALVHLVETSYSLCVKREAVFALCNICLNGSVAQLIHIVKAGTLHTLCSFLTEIFESNETNLIKNMLESIRNILTAGERSGQTLNPYLSIVEESGGLLSIDGLQQHDESAIVCLAEQIMVHYFDQEETVAEEDTTSPPSSFQF